VFTLKRAGDFCIPNFLRSRALEKRYEGAYPMDKLLHSFLKKKNFQPTAGLVQDHLVVIESSSHGLSLQVLF
jgi:hypothetical protein